MATRRERIIVEQFSADWKYRYDKEQYGLPDAWHIIHEKSVHGKWVGDCEDYALTLLWLFSDKSYLKFWWALISGKAKICLVGPSKWKVTHAVLRYNGVYVDNWTKELCPKSAIIDNGFTFHPFACLFYEVAIRMTYSWIRRKFK